MNNLFIDDKAIQFIKKALENDKAQAMRIFTSGGGCCKQFELTPVKKALTGDVTFRQGCVTVHIEKEIAQNTRSIWIKSDKQKRLIIEFE